MKHDDNHKMRPIRDFECTPAEPVLTTPTLTRIITIRSRDNLYTSHPTRLSLENLPIPQHAIHPQSTLMLPLHSFS